MKTPRRQYALYGSVAGCRRVLHSRPRRCSSRPPVSRILSHTWHAHRRVSCLYTAQYACLQSIGYIRGSLLVWQVYALSVAGSHMYAGAHSGGAPDCPSRWPRAHMPGGRICREVAYALAAMRTLPAMNLTGMLSDAHWETGGGHRDRL